MSSGHLGAREANWYIKMVNRIKKRRKINKTGYRIALGSSPSHVEKPPVVLGIAFLNLHGGFQDGGFF